MGISFVEKLQMIFSQLTDPVSKQEAEKKKLLKAVLRDITISRYKRFYKPKTEEVEIDMGKFFYVLYKTLAKTQFYLQKAEQSSQLKEAVIENFMNKDADGLVERLRANAIEERAKDVQPNEVAEEIKADIVALFSFFDAGKVKMINECYHTILRFINFVTFDYYSLLKKFDFDLPENDFTYTPRFCKVFGESISENLKDFMEIAYPMDMNLDWKRAIKILNEYKDAEIIGTDQWHKLLVRLNDIQNSSIFLLIVRYVEKNPVWQSKANIPNERIVENWLESKRLEAHEAIEKIVNAKRNAVVAVLVKAIFTMPEISHLSNYTQTANEPYIKQNLEGFTHISEMFYLKGFIKDIFKADINSLCDLFLVKGQWKEQILSQKMSDAVHQIFKIADQIEGFDKSLSNTGQYGDRLRIYAAKSEREKSYIKYANNLFKSLNGTAQEIINNAGQALIIIGKFLKTFLDDKQKKAYDFILNWREIEAASDTDICTRLEDAYNKIYSIVKLLKVFQDPLSVEK